MRRLLLALALAGCSSAPAPVACLTDDECAANEACVDGACAARIDGGRRDAGPCASGGCECIVAADCPSVAACADSVCESNRCVVAPRHERCAPLGLCDPTRGCVSASDGGPSDAAASDGGQDAGRDAGEDAGPPPAQIGDPCTSAADCSDLGSTAQCAMRESIGLATFEGGYCTRPCRRDADECGPGAVCWTSFLSMGMCLRECAADSECRTAESYVCGQPENGTLERATTACLPAAAAR